MPKIAVHVHIYYIKAWDKIEKYLRKIVKDGSCDITVFVTVSEIIPDSSILHIEENSTIPNLSLIRVPNFGYDVGPFLFFLKSIDLSDFDYIIKVHSKNVRWGIDQQLSNGCFVPRLVWPKYLMDAIFSTTRRFKNNLRMLEENPSLGMIGSKYLIVKYTNNNVDDHYIEYFANKLNYNELGDFKYIAGTMFLVRAKLLQPLIDSGIVNEDFEPSKRHTLGGTKAHALERIFGLLVYKQQSYISGFDNSCFKSLQTSKLLHSIRRLFLDKRVTNNGKILVRVFGIPVYNKSYKTKD